MFHINKKIIALLAIISFLLLLVIIFGLTPITNIPERITDKILEPFEETNKINSYGIGWSDETYLIKFKIKKFDKQKIIDKFKNKHFYLNKTIDFTLKNEKLIKIPIWWNPSINNNDTKLYLTNRYNSSYIMIQYNLKKEQCYLKIFYE